MKSYYLDKEPSDTEYEFIVKSSKLFSTIVDKFDTLQLVKEDKIRNNPEKWLTIFEDLEDLSGNMKRFLNSEKSHEINSKFTRNARLLKKCLNELSETFNGLLMITTGLITITQYDLIL
jgi:hypothetical protein